MVVAREGGSCGHAILSYVIARPQYRVEICTRQRVVAELWAWSEDNRRMRHDGTPSQNGPKDSLTAGKIQKLTNSVRRIAVCI